MKKRRRWKKKIRIKVRLLLTTSVNIAAATEKYETCKTNISKNKSESVEKLY